MRKKDVSKLRVGQCGGCSLRMRFWSIDGARVSYTNCGMEHEIECDEMLDLTTGEKSKIALLVGEGLGEAEQPRTKKLI